MTKVQKIWAFILYNNPTSKELRCFILGINIDQWENRFRGHYGTNIAEWRRKGHIETIDGTYRITKRSLKVGDGRMYVAIPKTKDQVHAEALECLTEERDIYRAEMFRLEEVIQNQELRMNHILDVLRNKVTLKTIHSLNK
jgi:hypothetical protein